MHGMSCAIFDYLLLFPNQRSVFSESAINSFRISNQSFPNQRLEVVNNAELQVVCAEVEAESLLTVRTSNLVVVVVAVTEETERSDEVNVLCEAYLNARLDSYFP